MNFLAHLYLSADRPKIMVGNFMGDFVKGRDFAGKFETEIVKGIRLHREIDSFTDSHPLVKQSKNRLRLKYRHYAGVILDVFYDHFLAAGWHHYHPTPLVDYAANAYALINSYEDILPEELKRMLPNMIQWNWLVNYASTDSIQRALSGMARRTPFESKMEEAQTDLIENYEAFQNDFQEFFPEVVDFAFRYVNNS